MIRLFITRPILAITLSIALLLVGVVAILNLSIEQYPDITPPVVQVAAAYPGADAQSVDQAVATPIGQQVMGVSDMLYMQSTSADDGSMNLQVTFAIGSDPDMDAIFTQNRVAQATPSLPESVAQQGLTTQKSQTGFLMVYALSGDERYDDKFLSNYAYMHIEDELLKINGVGKVSIMGAAKYAMRIWLYPERLSYYNIGVEEIARAIESQSGIYPAGKFGADPSELNTPFTYTVKMPPAISTEQEFSDIVLRTEEDGGVLRLSDVAKIELGTESYGSSSKYEDSASALIVIYQQPGSNAVEVGEMVRQKMEQLSEKFYDGMQYHKIVDATSSIRAGIEDIIITLIIALILVIAIIYLFLQDWRATLIPLIAIPVSLVGAFALFPLLGFSINIISLLGMVLAIGLVVDDAIVVVEAVQLKLEAGLSPKDATLEAMRSVSSPIIATTIVLLAVFIPVSFTGGITGLLFQQFSITIAVSVTLSAINALTLSPALSAMILRRHTPAEKGFFFRFNRWFDRQMESYDKGVQRLLRRSSGTLLIVGVSICAIVALWKLLPSGFLPEEDQGYVTLMVELPEAASLQRTEQVMARIEEIVTRNEAVEQVAYSSGFNMMAGVASSSSGVMFISLKDFDQRNITAMELSQRLNEQLFIEVAEAECYAFIPPSIPGLGVSSGISLEVQDLAGEGGNYLQKECFEWMDKLRDIPQIASVSTQYNGGIPHRALSIDKERALMMGIDLGELYNEITTLLGGEYLSNFSRWGELYKSYMQAAADYRSSESSLEEYYISSRGGEMVPLSEIVSVRDTVGASFVTRFNLYRSISLNITPAKGSSTGQVMELIEQSAENNLPDGIGFEWSGISYQQSQSSKAEGWVYLLALVFVFLTLAALYNSWGLPLAIILSVPLAVGGALLFVWLAHLFIPEYVNDIYMQISLVMLIGLSAKNAILVAEYADNIFFEQGLPLFDAARGAARLRIRPILMTAFAFILGVMPLIFASGVYSTARHIMGMALVGGMIVATLIGIFIYPSLYYLTAKFFGFERRRERIWAEMGKVAKVMFIAVGVSFLTGCVKLPAPNVNIPERYIMTEGESTDSLPHNIAWWLRFSDSTLNALQMRAIENNRNLAAAAARVEAARHTRRAKVASTLPSLSAGANANGSYYSSEGIEQQYSLSPSLSWEISLFGTIRYTKQAALAELLSEEWAFRGVVLSLTSEVASTYFSLLSSIDQLRIATRTTLLRAESAALIDSMVRYGMSTAVDLDRARSLLLTAQADRASAERDVEQALLSLQILLGDVPSHTPFTDWSDGIDNITIPEHIPAGLPSSLLERRPDMMQSLYAMEQAAAQVGLARAARLPVISLTASGGVVAELIKGASVESSPWFWSAAASLSAPLVTFGKLKGQERAAKELYFESIFNYKQNFLEAIGEVEKSLVAITTYREQVEKTRQLVATNEIVARKTEALYESGLSPYRDVIDARRSYYESELQLVELKEQWLQSHIDLIKALGGGW